MPGPGDQRDGEQPPEYDLSDDLTLGFERSTATPAPGAPGAPAIPSAAPGAPASGTGSWAPSAPGGPATPYSSATSAPGYPAHQSGTGGYPLAPGQPGQPGQLGLPPQSTSPVWPASSAGSAAASPASSSQTAPSHANPYLPQPWQATPPSPSGAAPSSAPGYGAAPYAAPSGVPAWGTPAGAPPAGAGPAQQGTSGYAAAPGGTRAPSRPGGYGPSTPAPVGFGRPARPTPKRNGGCVGIVVGAIVVLGFVIAGINNSRPDAPTGSDPQPTIANPSIPAAPAGSTAELAPTWTLAFDDSTGYPTNRDIYGLGGYQAGVVAAQDVLVSAMTRDFVGDEPVEVRALSVADGSTVWTATLDSVVCAQDVIATDAAPSGEVVVCAGARAGGEHLVQLDVASGAEVLDVEVDTPTASIAATTAGVALLGETDIDTASTSLAWYDVDGTRAWVTDLVDLDPDFAEDVSYEDEAIIYDASWGRFADGVLLGVGSSTYPLTAAEAGGPLECYSAYVGETGYVCDSYPITAFDAAGDELWTIDYDDMTSLAGGWGRWTTIPLGRSYESSGSVYSPFDPATGDVGDPLYATDEYPYVVGSPEHPLLALETGLIGISAEMDALIWEYDLKDGRPWAVGVAGDRILAAADDRVDVLDAATGAPVGSIPEGYGATPAGDRRAVSIGYDEMAFYALP